MIITIAGKAGENLEKSTYDCDILNIPNGKYLNSFDVLLCSDDPNMIVIGSQEAIGLQQKLLDHKLAIREVMPEYKEFDTKDSNSVFSLIFEILENIPLHETILLDITHGYRDHSMVASYAAMVSTFMSRHSISLIYAKMENRGEFRYVNLDTYSDLAEHTFYLRMFYHNCSVTDYRGDDQLLRAMYQFSENFLANNISKLIKESYPKLKLVLSEVQRLPHFVPLMSLITQIEKKLSFIDSFDNMPKSKQYLALSKFSENMNFSIIALTYLHESLSWYLIESLGDKLLTLKQNKEFDTYSKTQEIRSIIRRNESYFDSSFIKLLEEIRDMRNNLAHLSYDYGGDSIDIFDHYIGEVEALYKTDILGTIELPKRLLAGYQSDKDKQLSDLETVLSPYLERSGINKSTPYEYLIPELLKSSIKPSPYISKKCVNDLSTLMKDETFRKKVSEYNRILKG